MSPAAAFNIGSGWNNQRPTLGMDALSLIFALGLHLPLVFMKFDVHKKVIDRPGERLVSVDLIEPEKPKPVEETPALPPPPPKPTWMDKLKALAHKEPPPPPPPAPKPLPEKLLEAPKPLALQPKLDLPKVAPALESRAGFKPTADPKLLEQQQKLVNAPIPGIAPISALKLGVNDNRAAVKNSKGNFIIAYNYTLNGIGGGPTLADAAAPAIAIRTGRTATTENFSAPVTQKTDKGRIGAVPAGGLNSGPALGLRDSIIARDAAPTQITSHSSAGLPGGIPGGTGSKQDAGHFQTAGAPGGMVGGVGTAASLSSTAPTIPKKREKPSLFSIAGELQDRKILKQVAPEYPSWAQDQGISASVVLEFTVDPSGSVQVEWDCCAQDLRLS